jgi:arsenate reductase
MSRKPSVLFVCSGNSGRSIMAEAILNELGCGKFQAWSAGSHPTGRVNPLAIEELARRGYPTAHLRSKSWLEFTGADAPPLDFVIWVCDVSAQQKQPVWPGEPIELWWHFRAPGAVQGSDEDIRRVFSEVCSDIEASLKNFVLLPLDSVDVEALASMARCIPAQLNKGHFRVS